MIRAAVVALVVAIVGCSSSQDRAVEIVQEGRVLLKSPHPGGARWELRRATFMADSARWLQEVAPATSEAAPLPQCPEGPVNLQGSGVTFQCFGCYSEQAVLIRCNVCGLQGGPTLMRAHAHEAR